MKTSRIAFDDSANAAKRESLSVQSATLINKVLERLSLVFLVLLWTYTGLDKILRFDSSRNAFHNQTFPVELAEILSYAVPGVELLIALLLLFSVTRWWGYLGSILLLSVFTTYVGLIWVGAFPRVPCNCAGILESMGWAEHFILNLGLIGISILGLKLEGWKIEKLRLGIGRIREKGIGD